MTLGKAMKPNQTEYTTWFEWADAHIRDRKQAIAEARKPFSMAAIDILRRAAGAARSVGQDAVGAEHLLAAFLKIGKGRIAEVLAETHLTLSELKTAITREVGESKPLSVPWALPYTPRCSRIVERARKAAQSHGDRLIEPEDIFLALLAEKEGMPARLLKEKGLDSKALIDGFARNRAGAEWAQPGDTNNRDDAQGLREDH